jgi:hypothetical protein
VGKAVNIGSGYRSWKKNRAVYAARNKKPTLSQHCAGRASDITIKGMNGLAIAKAAIDACGPNLGIGLGNTFAHVDVRGVAACWNYGGVPPSWVDEIKLYQEEKRGTRRPDPRAGEGLEGGHPSLLEIAREWEDKPLWDPLEKPSAEELTTFPTGKFYGFLKENSFLRNKDLKTIQRFKGKPLFYPNKYQVEVLGEDAGWLLVKGEAHYEETVPVKREGWIKKSWVDMKERIPSPTRPAVSADPHVGKVVEIKGKVKAELGIKLHRTPNPAVKLKDSKIYPRNADVWIIGTPSSDNDQNWYKIRTDDGKEGWIESRYVVQLQDKRFDPLTKEYYVVAAGDMLEPLVKTRYSTYDIKTGDDFRTIVHAFSILNDGNPAIYYRGESDSWWRDKVFDRDMAGTRRVYASIKLRKGGVIYFPTESYINYLKDTGKVGQRPDWKNHAIDFGKAIIAFVEGFYESIEKIISDAWDDIKSLFSLSFFKDIYNLIKEIIVNPGLIIDIAKAMLQGVESILKNLTSSVASVKYGAYGSLIGLISGTIIMAMVVPGSTVTKGLAAARKLKVIQQIERQLERGVDEVKKLRRRLIKYKTQQKEWVKRWGKDAEKIMDVVDNRKKLRSSLELAKGVPLQAHHVIPIDVLKTNPTVQKAVIEGFEFNGKINGVAVSQKFHLAGHDEIHKVIDEEINEWARLNPNHSPKELKDYLEKNLVRRWKSNWKEAESKGYIEDADYRRRASELIRKRIK